MEFENYPVVRELDGVYVRAERNDKWRNRCFSDLTTDEQMSFLESLDDVGLKRMCLILVSALREIGDQFGIVSEDAEDEDNG